jgi:alkylated DNA repair dioxygenase AlkB
MGHYPMADRLFDERTPAREQLLPGSGSAMLFSWAFAPDTADNVLAAFLAVVPWEQHHVRLFGRAVAQPRLAAWYGDSNGMHTYSGLTLQPQPWPSVMAPMRAMCEQLAATSFNSARQPVSRWS